MKNLELELNIVGDISRKDIRGKGSAEAQYCALNPSREFIQKFYKFKEVGFNDGTTKNILHFYGEQGGWHPSSYNYNGTDHEKLKNISFFKIINL